MIDKQIRELVERHPKHYVHKIKSDPELHKWVEDHSSPEDTHWSTKIYCALTGETSTCKHGVKQTIKRISLGFTGCGPAATCQCTKERISESVKQTKSEISKDQQEIIQQRRKQTMIAKYGVAYNSQRKDIHHLWLKPKIDETAHQLLNDSDWVNHQYNILNKSLTEIAHELKVYYGTVGEYVRKHDFTVRRVVNQSLAEKQLADAISEMGVEVITGDWDILESKEIDIFIPAHKIGIEVNGLYWHSFHPGKSSHENKNQHWEKTTIAKENGVDLIHVTDWEWYNKQAQILSLIRSKLGLNKRIGARHTTLKEVSASQCRNFYESAHLQGFAAANKHLALVHDDNIVMACSIGRNRFTKNSHDEIIRVASTPGITVMGGLSKLLKDQDGPLMSYVDCDKFTGSGYEQVGFKRVRHSGPGYQWTDGTQPLSRYSCQKHKLANWLVGFNPEKSESENMFAAGYRRYWNCGNWVYERQ